jgi:hypothetical protein
LSSARLVSSLDADPTAEGAWERLAEARDAEMDAGVVAPVALEDAKARLRAKFPG